MKTLPPIKWQPETVAAMDALSKSSPGTVAERDAKAGMRMGEPYLIIVDQLIRIARNYECEFSQKIGADYVAAPEFSSMLTGVRAMLNFDGAAKWEAANNSGTRGHDTKDNGMLESLYWTACEIAGLDGDAL
jgi:hypothetical protein